MKMNAESVLLFVDINSDILKIIKKSVKDDNEKRVELTCKLLSVYQGLIGLTEEEVKKQDIMTKLRDIVREFYEESFISISRYRYQKMVGQMERFRSMMINLD